MQVNTNQKSIAEITNRYLESITLKTFIEDLGIQTSRQSVWQWKSGESKPSLETLKKVITNPTAASWAREWARECMMAIMVEYGFDPKDKVI
ncbi:MAG: hypothetical protein ABFD14_01310 [Anaerolineaceae bacterium]